MTEQPQLLVNEQGAILIATLDRPEKLNALGIELMRGLAEAVGHFRDTSDLKVMLIRASGPYFSAGADLREHPMQEPPATGSAIRELHRRLPSDMRRLWDEIEHIEKPFVVAHQGICLGGGLELSLSCDFRLAAASASYGFPETEFGILPATNGISRLTRIVGPHWARLMVMAGQRIDAAEALSMGLVHRVLADPTFDEEVMRFCTHLAAQDAEMMGTAKIAIELAADLGADQAATVERMANSALMMVPSYRGNARRHLAGVGGKDGDRGRGGSPD